MSREPVPPVTSSGKVPAAAWMTLLIFILLYLLSFFDRQILALLLLPIQQDLGLSDVQLGAVHGLAFSLFYASVGLLLGWAIDRYSKKWLMFAGVVIWSLATVACGLADSFGHLFAARLMVGFGEAVVGPAAFAVLVGIFPKERLGLVMGVYTSATNMGAAAVFIGGGAVVQALNAAGGITLPVLGALQPWQAAFVIIGAPGILFALLSFLIIEPRRIAADAVQASGERLATLGEFMRANRKIFAIHTAAFALMCMNAYAVISWSPAFLGRTFNWSPLTIGLVIGLSNGLVGFIGNLMWGAIADRLVARGRPDGAYRAFFVCVALSAPIVIATFLVGDPVLTVIGLCLSWLMLSAGGMHSAAGLFSPAHLRGRISALINLAVAVFAIGLTPLFVGAITDHVVHDHGKVGASIAVVNGICSALALILLWVGRKPLREAVARAGR